MFKAAPYESRSRMTAKLDRESLLLFWGKARPHSAESAQWHPLVYHGLDVAAVGLTLAEHRGMMPDWVALFGDHWRGVLGSLLALHDIGKFSRPFQSLNQEFWPKAVLGPYKNQGHGPRHDSLGHGLLQILLNEEQERKHFLGAWKWRHLTVLLAPFVGHHGYAVSAPMIDPGEVFGAKVLSVAHDFLDEMAALFQPQLPPYTEQMRTPLIRASWELAGLTVLADWIGSHQTWFPYRPNTIDPARYWQDYAWPQAQQAVQQAGVRPSRPNPHISFHALIGTDHHPSPVQHWAETVALPAGPILALIEDMTGSGKTEASLILAHRLMATGQARGLYGALPTMATANAMYGRLAACYRRLFHSEDQPSLVLAHGATALHDGFRDSVETLGTSQGVRTGTGDEDTQGDEASAACTAWLADSRRKCFLADVGVGTIDQALLAVLPVKYQALRLFGLRDHVLVVDEAHAYDVYMGTELERLLTFQAALGGSAVVLSATLPLAKRQALADAFSRGLVGAVAPVLEKTGYPLTALVSAVGASEVVCETRPGLARALTVSRLASPTEAVHRIAEAVRTGAAVAWVRNTVDDAYAAVSALEAEGIPAMLFHARFAMGDRLAIEAQVIERFGKTSDPAQRPGVLVSTQVIEQSLDLDFDLMVSDLAPIDLLLQRAGRLWRHERGLRSVAYPHLLVLSPDPTGLDGATSPSRPEGITARWCQALLPGTAAVYKNHGLLWLTARVLFQQAIWRIPEDVRRLVEAVYAPQEILTIPDGLQRAALKADGEDRAAGSQADRLVLKVAGGYAGNAGRWDDDTRTPTRLGEETRILRLARWQDGNLQPWCPNDDPSRAWALSEVSVRASRVCGVPKPSGDQARAAAQACASWTRHDVEKLLLILESKAQGLWQGQVLSQKGEKTTVDYTVFGGLHFSK